MPKGATSNLNLLYSKVSNYKRYWQNLRSEGTVLATELKGVYYSQYLVISKSQIPSWKDQGCLQKKR